MSAAAVMAWLGAMSVGGWGWIGVCPERLLPLVAACHDVAWLGAWQACPLGQRDIATRWTIVGRGCAGVVGDGRRHAGAFGVGENAGERAVLSQFSLALSG